MFDKKKIYRRKI